MHAPTSLLGWFMTYSIQRLLYLCTGRAVSLSLVVGPAKEGSSLNVMARFKDHRRRREMLD
jgi:hypothetical protein